MTKSDKRVRLYPADRFIGGVAAVERIVPAHVADVLIGSGAFTRERPDDQAEPSADVREDIDDIIREVPELREAPEVEEVPEQQPVTTTPGGQHEQTVSTEATNNA